MSRVGKLLGKASEVELEGETFKIYPLPVDDIELFTKLSGNDETKTKEAIKELIYKSLKQGEPDITMEEIGRIPVTHLTTISEAIIEVNGLKDKLKKKEET